MQEWKSFLVRVALVIQSLLHHMAAQNLGPFNWQDGWQSEITRFHCYCLRSSDLDRSDRLQITTLSNNRNRFAAADELANQLSSNNFDIIMIWD